MVNRILNLLLWLIIAGSLAIQLYYYPKMPDRVAIHFNAFGRADSWTTPGKQLLIDCGLLLGLGLLFQLMLFLLPRFSDEMISMPNKKYWLADQRRAATLQVVKRYLLWLADLTLLFLAGLFYLVTEVNYYRRTQLGNEFWLLFVLFLLAVIILIGAMMARFSKTPEASASSD